MTWLDRLREARDKARLEQLRGQYSDIGDRASGTSLQQGGRPAGTGMNTGMITPEGGYQMMPPQGGFQPFNMAEQRINPSMLPSFRHDEPTPVAPTGTLGKIGAIANIAGTAADIYGGFREGAARDKEIEARRQAEKERLELERKRQEDERMMALFGMIGKAPPRY